MSPAPLPVGLRAAEARRRHVDALRAAVAAGVYRVEAELVADAILGAASGRQHPR